MMRTVFVFLAEEHHLSELLHPVVLALVVYSFVSELGAGARECVVYVYQVGDFLFRVGFSASRLSLLKPACCISSSLSCSDKS